MSNTATRVALLYAYIRTDGPCPCGQQRGHTGWIVCALQDPVPKTQAHSAHQEDTNAAPIPPEAV